MNLQWGGGAHPAPPGHPRFTSFSQSLDTSTHFRRIPLLRLLNVYLLIQRWDGSHWKTVGSPNPGSKASCKGFNAGNFLNAVAQTGGEQTTMVQHFDGHNWTIISSPTKGVAPQLWGAFALPGSSDLWIVGAYSTNQIDPETGFLQVPKTLVIFSPTS